MQIFGRNQYGDGSHARSSGLGGLFVLWGFSLVLWLAGIGGSIFVAVHFIRKFW